MVVVTKSPAAVTEGVPADPSKRVENRELRVLLDEMISGIQAAQDGVNRLANADLATTADITLSGEQVIDGTLTGASRVLVKDQSDPVENGVYVTGAGAWTRAPDADLALAYIRVSGGATLGATNWQVVDSPAHDVDPVVWARVGDSAIQSTDDLPQGATNLYLTAELRDKILDQQDPAPATSSIWRTDTPEALTADLAGAPEGRAPFDGGAVVAVDGLGQALAVSGADVAAAGTELALAFRQAFPIEPGRLYRLRQTVTRVADPTDPSNHAVRLQLAQLSADWATEVTSELVTWTDLDVATGARAHAVTVSKSADLGADITLSADTAYLSPILTVWGTEPGHQVAWLGVVIEDITDLAGLAEVASSGLISHLENTPEFVKMTVEEREVIKAAGRKVRSNPGPGQTPEIIVNEGANCRIPDLTVFLDPAAPGVAVPGRNFALPDPGVTEFVYLDISAPPAITLEVTEDLAVVNDPERAIFVIALGADGFSNSVVQARYVPISAPAGSEAGNTYADANSALAAQILPYAWGNKSGGGLRPGGTALQALPSALWGQQFELTAGSNWDLSGLTPGTFHALNIGEAPAFVWAGRDGLAPQGFLGLDPAQTRLTVPPGGVVEVTKLRNHAPLIHLKSGQGAVDAVPTPAYEATIVGLGQSIWSRGAAEGLQGGLCWTLNSGEGIAGPVPEALGLVDAATGGSSITQAAAVADNYHVTTAGLAGPREIWAADQLAASAAAGDPAPGLFVLAAGQSDAHAIESGALNGGTFKFHAISYLDRMRARVTQIWPGAPAPPVAILFPGVKEIEESTQGFIQVHALLHEIVAENDWAHAGPAAYDGPRAFNDPHNLPSFNQVLAARLAAIYANLVHGQANPIGPTVAEVTRDAEQGYYNVRLDLVAGRDLLPPVPVGHDIVDPYPAGFGILNSARQLVPAEFARVTSPNNLRIFCADGPATGSVIFPVGARAGFEKTGHFWKLGLPNGGHVYDALGGATLPQLPCNIAW